MLNRGLEWMMRRTLRSALHDITLCGPRPQIAADVSVVLYMNHQYFYDGYVAWWFLKEVLNRNCVVWMKEWQRFPFFAAVGAYPFPEDQPRQRLRTIKRTMERIQTRPQDALLLFPEGEMHAMNEPLLPFDDRLFATLHRLAPDTLYVPLALHVTHTNEALPSARLLCGAPHSTPTGEERKTLEALTNTLRHSLCPSADVLLRGTPSPNARWSFDFAAPWFERYL
ncbi:MAG: acyltransferase [Rhodothermales bacterium]